MYSDIRTLYDDVTKIKIDSIYYEKECNNELTTYMYSTKSNNGLLASGAIVRDV